MSPRTGNSSNSNRSNQQFANQGNIPNPLESIEAGMDYHESEFNKLQEAREILINSQSFQGSNPGNYQNEDSFDEQNSMVASGKFRSSSWRNSGQGSNIASGNSKRVTGNAQGVRAQGNPQNEDGSPDRRFKSNRLATDDQEIGVDDIDMNDLPMNQDGSVDLRTKEGRALQSAGWVDEDGFFTEDGDAQLQSTRGSNKQPQRFNRSTGRHASTTGTARTR